MEASINATKPGVPWLHQIRTDRITSEAEPWKTELVLPKSLTSSKQCSTEEKGQHFRENQISRRITNKWIGV